MIHLDVRRLRLVVIATLLILVIPRPSYAYLDPGSASYTLQMLIALLLSVAFVLKAYWAKLKRLIVGLVSPSEKTKDELPESPSNDAS